MVEWLYSARVRERLLRVRIQEGDISMADTAYIIRVNGRVQGVGFRATTQMLADRMEIRGDVRNQSDGSVLIHAVGTDTQMSAFREAIKQGPSQFARVSTYEETPMKSVPEYNGFNVVY